jgi:hypothetical protein
VLVRRNSEARSRKPLPGSGCRLGNCLGTGLPRSTTWPRSGARGCSPMPPSCGKRRE